jgi:hypothetical protein
MKNVTCLLAVALATGCASKTPPPAATAAPGAVPGSALNSPSPPAVRPAEAILADSVRATGGAAAWNAHKTLRSKIEIVFQGMGMGGTGERLATSAGKSLVVTEMAGLGTAREGTDGKVFWSQDPIMGFRFLEGAEAEQARIEANWNSELHAKELFAKLESATETAPDGKTQLECVIATPKVGNPIRSCFDAQTHLHVVQKGVRTTPQGDVPFRAVSRDWREIGGLKLAFESEAQMGPVTLIVKIKSVTFDEPIDDKVFEPPIPAKTAATTAP